MDFRNYIREMVKGRSTGLEIGPSYSPILPKKQGYSVLSVDHADQETLRKKYADDPAVDVSRIEEVDIIDNGGEFLDYSPKRKGFDYIVASHVLEHVVDPVHFLQRAQRALKFDGRLFLLVPDRRFCFDFLRPVSTCGQMLAVYLEGRTTHRSSLYDQAALAVVKNGAIAWADSAPAEFAFSDTPHNGYAAITRSDGEYVDSHAWVFTPSSLRLILTDLRALGMISLGEAFFHESVGCEFMLVLSPSAPAPALDRMELAQRALRETAVGISRTDSPDELESLKARLAEQGGLIRSYEHEISQLRGSRSWRITAPLRFLWDCLPKPRPAASAPVPAKPHEPSAPEKTAPAEVSSSGEPGFHFGDWLCRRAPSAQNAVDIFSGAWGTAFPPDLALKAGETALYDDARIHWLVNNIAGGVNGLDVLELGPLEAGHTAMLLEAGAGSVLAVEANKIAYLRCLVVKEIRNLRMASFLLGDFVRFLESDGRRWPLVVASGVLYHMEDPVRLLELLARKTDTLFIWTHVIDGAAMLPGDPRWSFFLEGEMKTWRDVDLILYPRPYPSITPYGYGGLSDTPRWLERRGLFAVLERLGFDSILVDRDQPDHVFGPCLSLLARRTNG